MEVIYRHALVNDAELIALLVIELTNEISSVTNANQFDINLEQTAEQCRSLINNGKYNVIIAESLGEIIAFAAMSETYALYAGGKLGIVQECYVKKQYRNAGIGESLLKQVTKYGKMKGWACIELCTPPLPEFENTLKFYEKNGLKAVGGRKMRLKISDT